jgi:hypothetical protein
MVYNGHVEKGIVVIDDPVALPDGQKVQIAVLPTGQAEIASNDDIETLDQKWLKHAGKAVGLPPDLAENHDHYLYGTPKQ